ncbi:hypothetical protein [Prevotella pallens]|uniref:Flagellar motor protein MotB n=1 Tax=Prevotella pallens TaxID=60133 RepID=A0A379EYZ9_9BACT|nr:hypothetical protein [Prevotella pallens]SUC11619.1 Uncharacterised protein [Prevotella pallens]
MARGKHKDPFWTSYSDLMTSLFFVMLVLFIICLIKVGGTNRKLAKALEGANVTIEQQNQILQLDSLFSVLSKATSLDYEPEKKIFYAKAFQEKEIFYPNDDKIKEEYISTVDKVGHDIEAILKRLNANNKFSYQMIIEGNAAIKWDKLKTGNYDPDNITMYHLSYNRALALYNRWRIVDKLDFRAYNTEVIIAGSGFNGINRDLNVEEYNKRFILQIIPKISRPTIRK